MSDDLYRDLVALTAKDGLEKYNYVVKIGDEDIRVALSSARVEGQLVPVLGAGVSLPSGLDNWQILVEKAAEKLFANTAIPEMGDILTTSGKSSIRQIRFCEATANLKTAFRVFLMETLYRNYDPAKMNSNLEVLSEIILGIDGRRQIKNVITYNFDNLLEIALAKKAKQNGVNVKIFPVFDDETYKRAKQENTICIFHPHGYLPYGKSFGIVSKLPIVFSETDYHRHFQESSYWANALQLDIFQRNTCMFVGISFECPNMRRLLDYVQFKGPAAYTHVAIMRVSASTKRNLENYLVEVDLNSLGVRPAWIAQYGDIPGLITRI